MEKKVLLDQERFELQADCGVLSYEVWGCKELRKTYVTGYNYSYSYSNSLMYAGDNGRVLGFDNAQDYHHRHFKGDVTPVEFVSYEATLERFQREWRDLVDTFHKSKKMSEGLMRDQDINGFFGRAKQAFRRGA